MLLPDRSPDECSLRGGSWHKTLVFHASEGAHATKYQNLSWKAEAGFDFCRRVKVRVSLQGRSCAGKTAVMPRWPRRRFCKCTCEGGQVLSPHLDQAGEGRLTWGGSAVPEVVLVEQVSDQPTVKQYAEAILVRLLLNRPALAEELLGPILLHYTDKYASLLPAFRMKGGRLFPM